MVLKASQIHVCFIGLRKMPVFKTGQNFFSLPIVLLLPLPHDINAILISLVEGNSLKFLKL